MGRNDYPHIVVCGGARSPVGVKSWHEDIRRSGIDRAKIDAAIGARLVVDLMYEMQRRETRYGCVAVCIGGGQGVALVLRDADKP
ncbi:MAG: hypothetical protein V1790_00680 [Planctomycetota bacterium]